MNQTIRSATDGARTPPTPVAPGGAQRVRRGAILSAVLADNAPPIVILQAPAGYGKSTLMQQIREEYRARGFRCGWLTLDDSDNDASHHAAHVRRELGGLIPGRKRGGRDASAFATLSDRTDWLIDALNRDRTPMALFVDEFEVLSSRDVINVWKDLLARLPQHVRVFIAARASPDVGVPRLAVSDRVLVLGSRELRFSAEEVRSFFGGSGAHDTAEPDILEIHRRTEGWPAAIQLFRLGLSRLAPAEVLSGLDQYHPRELADYLTDCVLDGLTHDVRHFLERTSILERLHPQVCNALTGRSDSLTVLTRLEKQGMFLDAIEGCELWFRYHSLFASQLRQQMLRDDPVLFRQLHRQAADWFFANGMHREAIHHAVAADQLGFAADILEQWSEELVSSGELSIAARWYDCLPKTEIRNRPLLCRRMAWAMAFLSRRDELASLLGQDDSEAADIDSINRAELPLRAMVAICADRMDAAFEIVSRIRPAWDDAVRSDRFLAFEQSAAANLDAYRCLVTGDFGEVQALLAVARLLNEHAQAYFSAGYTATVQGLDLLLRGRMPAAVTQLLEGLAVQRRGLDLPYATAPLACVCLWALHESDRTDDVVGTFTAYRDMVLNCAVPDLFVVGVLAAMRALEQSRQPDSCRALHAEALAIAQFNGWPRIADVLQCDIMGAGQPAPEAAAGGERQWLRFADHFTGAYLQPIRSAIRHRRYHEASKLMAMLAEQWPDCVLVSMRLGFCRALMLEARGMRNPALRHFTASLRIAQASGYVRSARDNIESSGGLLGHYLESTRSDAASPLREFALGLARDIDPRVSAQFEAAQDEVSLDQFTAREREIIDYLRRRMSNREIASCADVSENTVKFHLKNIYAKLNVKSRYDALAVLAGDKRASF